MSEAGRTATPAEEFPKGIEQARFQVRAENMREQYPNPRSHHGSERMPAWVT